MGTELQRRGVALDGPAWSAQALVSSPGIVREIHAAYASAGATVHTANTFRTRRLDPWREWTARAVTLARQAVPPGHRVAGSMAPVQDCYRPDLCPQDPRPHHRELAQCLADCGVDLLLCETFPQLREGWIAVEEAVATGLETWIAFSPGPFAPLLSAEELRTGAEGAVERGAACVLVNCMPWVHATSCLRAISRCGVPTGVYANAATPHQGVSPDAFVEHALEWLAAGARVVGGCCGVGPEQIRSLSKALAQRLPPDGL